MNILIPLGGLGQRFKDVGYELPKPLIKALGKEIIFWLLDSLKTYKKDNIYIVYNKDLSIFGFENLFQDQKIKLFKLSRNTNGPVETCYEFLSLLPKNKKKEKLIIVDGDTFYNFDLLKKVRKLKNSAVVYSKTNLTKPIYSYIRETNGNLIDIKEKIKISDKFNIGSYFFENIDIFLFHSSKVLTKTKDAYISDVYKNMLKFKILVKTVFIPQSKFTCLGTPEQLTSFCIKNSSFLKKTFSFDIHSLMNFDNKYNVDRYLENIKFLKMLKNQGHTIILYSYKLSKLKKNKLSYFLKQSNIIYDKIIFTKPKADFYIQPNSIDSNKSLNFRLGFYDYTDTESRSFNKITIGENFTIKTSKEINKLSNEIKFLKKIPFKIKNLFPCIHDHGKDWYKMDTIKGTNISYLFINNLMNEEVLYKIILSIRKIHKNSYNSGKIYENYIPKISKRINLIKDKYIKLDNKKYKMLLNLLSEYQNQKMGINGIIHGDPVFSNIFINFQGSIIFIDPRGGQMDNFSLNGDIIYDYAKIYQSLLGYDYIVNDIKYVENKNLLKLFEETFTSYFSKEYFKFLKIITSSLYLSLIPFHKKKYSNYFYDKYLKLLK